MPAITTNDLKNGITLQLDGTGSSHTNGTATPLTFQWTQISGKDWFDVAASIGTWSATSSQPSFAATPAFTARTPAACAAVTTSSRRSCVRVGSPTTKERVMSEW